MRSRILFVDDEPLMREFYGMVGSMLGSDYEVFTVSSGREGLAFLQKTAVDIVVSDLVMPEMNGRELAARLNARLPNTKVVFMSGYTDDTISRHGGLGDDVLFLEKPFTPDALLRKVREALDR